METPVLFLIFNRPDLTERVFATIREAKPPKLFIAADGVREHKVGEAELCQQTRDAVLQNIDWDCEVHTLLRDSNLGCKIAVSNAITWFFENVEAGIILEDDILPDPSFFTFCEAMLVKYKDDDRVTQISGVNLMGQSDISESYFFSKVGGIWGWATWGRVWKAYDVSIQDWGKPEIKSKIKRFLGKKDWFDRVKGSFDMVYNNQYDTWDFQWVFAQFKLNGIAIIPSVNLIENIGFRADATHTKNSNEFIESKMKSHYLSLPIIHPFEVISNEKYEAYYFDLLDKPQGFIKNILNRTKNKVKNVFK